jgi:hypothetical protein
MALKRKPTIPLSKITAIGIGVSLAAVETWLNVDFVSKTEGLLSSPVAAVVASSVGAAAAIPYAERSAKQGHWLKAFGYALFFVLMVCFSITSSVDRIGTKHDRQTDSIKADNATVQLRREAYAAAQRKQEAECTKHGPRCRAAEDATEAARKGLIENPAQRVEDPMAARISAVLGFVTAEQVALYQPLFLPVALQLGGFLMLAYGFGPRLTEAGQPRRKKGNRKPRKPRKPSAKMVQAVPSKPKLVAVK